TIQRRKSSSIPAPSPVNEPSAPPPASIIGVPSGTAGPLPFESKDFVIMLKDEDEPGKNVNASLGSPSGLLPGLTFTISGSFSGVQSPKMEGTIFTPALQEIEHVKSDQGEILSKLFLDACKHILPVIGEIQLSNVGSIWWEDLFSHLLWGNLERLVAKQSIGGAITRAFVQLRWACL
ncbi:Glycolipid transfer protein 1, partial [Glycine soja]